MRDFYAKNQRSIGGKDIRQAMKIMDPFLKAGGIQTSKRQVSIPAPPRFTSGNQNKTSVSGSGYGFGSAPNPRDREISAKSQQRLEYERKGPELDLGLIGAKIRI